MYLLSTVDRKEIYKVCVGVREGESFYIFLVGGCLQKLWSMFLTVV